MTDQSMYHAPPQQQPYAPPQQQPYAPPQQQPYAPPQQQPYPQQYPQPYGQQQPQPYAQQQVQPYPQQYQQPYGQQYPQQYPQQNAQEQQPAPAQGSKKKRGFWSIFFIVLFSPFIAIYFVLKALYWVFTWLMTPVALVVHFVLCALGLIWYTPVKLLASGRSEHRLLQPRYPRFPPFWSAEYWVLLRSRVKQTCEFGVGIAQAVAAFS